MKKLVSILMALVMLLGSAAAVAEGTVSTDGSTPMEKVIGALGEYFTEENKGVNFTYNPTGSGSGIAAVLEGRCDIGLSSRDLKDAEIVLIGREAGSGTRDGFETITGTNDACQYRQELTSTGDVITAVSQNSAAIGYASLAALKDTVKAVSVEGVVPSEETVKDGSYRVQRPFVLVTRKDVPLTETAQKFFDFATSADAAWIISLAGAVSAADTTAAASSNHKSDKPPPVRATRADRPHAYRAAKERNALKKRRLFETAMHGLFLLLGLIAVGFVLLITVYLIVSGIPAIRRIGLIPFLFGTKWASTAAEPSFGILPFILTSVYGTAGAVLIGVPIGFLTAVYLSKVANAKVRAIMENAVSLLAGIPSVVYGLVGMLVLLPGIRKLFGVPDGSSLLAAIIVLSVMILPSIIKVSMTALDAVPKEYEDASLALGATPIETYFRVSVPAAKSGIAAAVVLGVGRAIGEAMAVMMVSGNVPNMPSLFESVRFLTTAVASEMAYSSGLQQQALFSIALVLFLFIMLINACLNFFLKRNKEG